MLLNFELQINTYNTNNGLSTYNEMNNSSNLEKADFENNQLFVLLHPLKFYLQHNQVVVLVLWAPPSPKRLSSGHLSALFINHTF